MPKQAQGYVVAGLAVLILMAVMFSKNHPKPTATGTASSSTTLSTDVNQQKIHELEQDLSADQRQSQQQQTLKENAAGPPAGNTSPVQPNGMTPATQSPPATEPPRDPIADAEKALVFKARFASNLVSGNDTIPGAASSAPASVVASGAPSANNSSASSAVPAPQHSDSDAKRPPEVNLNSRSRPALCALRGNYHRHLSGDAPRWGVCRVGQGHGDQSRLQPGPPACVDSRRNIHSRQRTEGLRLWTETPRRRLPTA